MPVSFLSIKVFLVTGLLCFLNLAKSFAAPQGRQRFLMDRNWKFSQTDTVGAIEYGFNDNKWRSLNLPHDWSIEGEFKENAATGGGGGYLPSGIGWYRKHFVLPVSPAGKAVWIEFDGVYMNSDVWINGHHLGHYPNGYMSFYYDISSFIKRGGNIITVRVDNSFQPNTRWYSGSGIYRHVWLNISNALHVAQWGTLITTPAVNTTSSTVAVAITLDNKNPVSKNVSLRSVVKDEAGNAVATSLSTVTAKAGGQVTVEQSIIVPSPKLWSTATPVMYTLQAMIIENGVTTDEISTPFGIRQIYYDRDKGFLLNGKHVKLNGVCIHHDAGSVGAAVPEAMWIRRLQVLKAMGCNAIRTSHNPVAPEFLDLCDRMGFLVQDEVFDEWKIGKVKYGYNNYFNEWWQKDATAFIRRDRNHPSVVMWSAGNEIREQRSPTGHELLKQLIDLFHTEDPTRPVTTGNDLIAADDGKATLSWLNLLDIVGYNYVDRWHERRELFYDIDRHDHPEWKMTGTESVSIPGMRGNYFGSGPGTIDSSIIKPLNMASLVRAEQLWKFVAVHDYVIGDFMWTGIDYLGEARWPNKQSSSGVIDLCGFPKDGYYFYQSQWTSTPMIHLFPHWNWKGREGKIIPVMAFTNCDTVELFVNGKSFGMKSISFPRQGNSGAWNRYDSPLVNTTTGDLHLSWDVPFEAGVLKAVGRKGGRIVVQEELRTTGIPSAIRLVANRERIKSGMQNVAHIRVEIIDENGNIIPDADLPVQLSVEGDGMLIGFDNGNPRDHDPMKSNQRKTFNGLALAVVQSTGKAGSIRIKATSKGLKEGTENIITFLTAGTAVTL